MTDVVRLGGQADLPSGERVIWSVAAGRHGRRWREVATRAGVVDRTVLFETDPDGRLMRLELASSAGLLTIHPNDSGVLHGNVVTHDRVRHLEFAEHTGAALFVPGSPAAAAIALGWLAGLVDIGTTRRVPILRIDGRLEPAPAAWDVTRLDERSWRMAIVESGSGGEIREAVLDADGLAVPPGEVAWPLEP